MKKKIAITGATGFLGQHLVANLKNNSNYEVLAIGRNKTIGQQLDVEFTELDIRDKAQILQSVKGVDIIIHCAALSAPWGKKKDFYTINVEGTNNIISAAQRNGVEKLIHISSPSIYFDFTDRVNLTEESYIPKQQVNHYAASKLLAENIVNKSSQEGLNTIILRPRGIYGEGDTAILPRLIKAVQKKRLFVIGNGENIVDLTYVENVVQAIICSLKASKQANRKTFNITNDEPIQLWPLLKTLFEKLEYSFDINKKISWPYAYTYAYLSELMTLICNKEEPLLTRYSAGILAKSQTFDISAAKTILGYKPTINVITGIERVVQWWKQKQ